MRKNLTKIIPFDLKKAKRIMNGEMKGRITDSQGRKIRIVATDVVGGQPILALVDYFDGKETPQLYNIDGTHPSDRGKDLRIVVRTRYKDYSDFTPSLFQSCLAREGQSDIWKVCVFLGKTTYGSMMFLMSDNEEYEFPEFLPLSKDTYGLIDSTASYKDYINELI
jgi:hypothetical protein